MVVGLSFAVGTMHLGWYKTLHGDGNGFTFPVTQVLVRSLLTQQSTATIMVLSLKLNKWGLGNAEYAWIRKCALQSLTLPGSTAS